MKIKKVNMVSQEDLEGLVKSLELYIWALEKGAIEGTINSLKILKKNIEANLKEGAQDEI